MLDCLIVCHVQTNLLKRLQKDFVNSLFKIPVHAFQRHLEKLLFSWTFQEMETDNLTFQDFQLFWDVVELSVSAGMNNTLILTQNAL